MADIVVITDLLSKLASEQKGISWRMSCCFTDGIGKSFHKIIIERKLNKEEKIIVFQMETGQVVNYGCKGIHLAENAEIIDVLLDLINEEKLLTPQPY